MQPSHVRNIIIGLLVVSFAASLRMLVVGAWPVVAFLLLDIAALGFAFYINFRRAKMQETVVLNDTQLSVTRMHPSGVEESWVFEPYWVKVKLQKTSTGRPVCLLSLHNQQVSLGSFLHEDAVKELYKNLANALLEWKNREFT